MKTHSSRSPTTNAPATFMFEELQLTRQLRLQAAARIEQANVNGQGSHRVADERFSGVLHAFKKDEIGVNEIETAGYTLVSARLKFERGTSWARETTIGIKGEIPADNMVLNHSSFKRREHVLLPGANVRLFGSIKLNQCWLGREGSNLRMAESKSAT